MRELLKEAARALDDELHGIHDCSMDGAIKRRSGKEALLARITTALAAPEPRKCPDCDGQGWTAQHSIDGNAHDDEGNCNPGYCPVQVQCEKCSGTGKIAAPEPDAMEIVDKLEKLLNMDQAIFPPQSSYSEAAALIASYSRRVPRAISDIAGKLEEAIDSEDWNEAKSALNDLWDLRDDGYKVEG